MVGVKASDILQPLPLAHGFLAANDYGVGVVNNSVADFLPAFLYFPRRIISYTFSAEGMSNQVP